jgi:4-aminobutyrate aminotransferase
MNKELYPELKTELPGPKAAEVLKKDKTYISPSYTRSYPLVVDRGEGVYIWDIDGNKFIDVNAGIAVCSTGHSHPKVVEAIINQTKKFIHMSGTDFYYEPEVLLAERLSELAPGRRPKKTFLSNSGTEAVECAMKLARYHTGRQKFMAFLGAFHGRTYGSLSLSASKAMQRSKFAPLLPEVIHVPYAYCYRCPFNLKPESCHLACVSFIEEEVFHRLCQPDEVAAIFVEPVLGEGGYIFPPKDFLKALRIMCDKYGMLLVVDEIQTGFGRTGKMFAFEHSTIVPDIITCAKGIASGMPIGATIADSDVMNWPPGAHGNTFGGNPISCAAALATLDLIEEELVFNAQQVGNYMITRARDMVEEHPTIGRADGLGLMIGVELVLDKETKEPASEIRDMVIDRLYQKGIAALGCGASTVRFMPPLVITEEQAAIVMDLFDDALSEVEEASLAKQRS